MDPRELGAKCDECPLSHCKPIASKRADGVAKLSIVTESPTQQDEADGTVTLGASGYMLKQSLQRWGGSYDTDCHKTPALLCRLDRHLTPTEEKKAIACCRPRLMTELSGGPSTILAVGKLALVSLTGKAKLDDYLGAPLPVDGRTVIPCFHAGRALAKPALTPVFRILVGRAWQAATGELPAWEWPELVIEPGPRMVEALRELRDSGAPLGIDIETGGINPLENALTAIGLASENLAVSLPWDAYDAGKFGAVLPIHEQPCGAEIAALVIEILGSQQPKVMQNGSHDILGLEAKGIVVANYAFDTLYAHAAVASQQPHKLWWIATSEFAMPAWKAEFHVGSDLKGAEVFVKRDPLDLRRYNAKDATVTVRLMRPLQERLDKTHKGHAIFGDFMRLAPIAMQMRKFGATVDPVAKKEVRLVLSAKRRHYARVFHQQTAGKYKLGKSGQHPDLKRLFFEDLRVKPTRYTEETHSPQLNGAFLTDMLKSSDQRAAMLARTIIPYRKATKLMSTYIDGLPVGGDGRLHPTWNVHGTVGWRWSSAEPNFQNWPGSMKSIVRARPGNTIVAADMAQLEMRIVALLAGAKGLLDGFAGEEKIHAINARTFFRTKNYTPEQYRAAKNLGFAFNYNASSDAQKVHASLLPIFPDLRLAHVEYFRKTWFQAHPEIRAWQLRSIKKANEVGYVEDFLTGRRRYFHDGRVDPNEVLSFLVQTPAGYIINRAVFPIASALNWTDEGILANIHDDLTTEGPDPDRLVALSQQHMTQELEYKGNKVVLTVETKVGKNWGKLK